MSSKKSNRATKSRSSRSSGKAEGRKSTNPPAAASVYRGPFRLPGSSGQAHTTTEELTSVATIASSAGGTITTVYNNDPSGYGDWGSYAAIWDEYRVLAMTMKFVPYNRYNKTTTTCTPVYTVIDRDSAGALASKAAAVNFESCKIRSLEDPWVMRARMTAAPDDSFITTAATASTWWFKHYADGLSVSTNYGDMVFCLLVQFRGKN